MQPTIRPLDPLSDLALVEAFNRQAADYWLLADRAPPGPQKAADFFTDGPPGCDPARSHRLGLFAEGALVGLAELSFGFPQPQDAYLGLMILHPDARGRGYGRQFLGHIEGLARAEGCPRLYLAVLQENPRGRAFWEGQGFQPTGVSRLDDETGHVVYRLVKVL
ncbi:GNAT family N-acetyltransferase [Fuscibacter oryzae]|uniref:GNAT family N-acetyltransferase n=1 Tax=Fuscibacter oryzae TaxID=2803939 RepID=A0A8J7SRB0_9RHOB|nr:GNAT family N-acetyltransferase [Fuscibacter oryzae]MBL4926765.1 GNAT family N-acetyltransferase [Fuscibacter oryzae]